MRKILLALLVAALAITAAACSAGDGDDDGEAADTGAARPFHRYTDETSTLSAGRSVVFRQFFRGSISYPPSSVGP